MTTAITTRGAAPITRVTGPAPAAAYLARLRSIEGRRAMQWKLDRAAGLLSSGRHDAMTLPWHVLTPAALAGLVTVLAGGVDGARPYAARTVNATVAAVRGVLKECWRMGMLDADQLTRLTDGIRPEPTPAEASGRMLAPGEVAALFNAAAADLGPLRGARDAAMLAILFGAGLRAAEAAALDVGDLDRQAETVAVRRGKGRRARVVPLAAGGADAIGAWVDAGRLIEGPLLRQVLRGDRIAGRLGPRAMLDHVTRLAAAAGVAAWTPHDARRTHISTLLDAGADIATVAGIAGHADVSTTARYDRRGAEARRKAARLIAVPYRRRGVG